MSENNSNNPQRSPPAAPQGSPPGSPSSDGPGGGIPFPLAPTPVSPMPSIAVTMKTMMAGKNNEFVLFVPQDITVMNLKHLLAERCDIPADSQLLFIADTKLDDDKTLPHYGVTNACTITMHVKLVAGQRKQSSSDVILFVPNLFPTGDDALRSMIRGMSKGSRKSSRPRRKEKPVESSSQIWTPAKDAENELTRNRMKNLLRRRSRSREASGLTPESGSVIGSVESSQPSTPPEWSTSSHTSLVSSASAASSTAPSPCASSTSILDTGDPPVTEKELARFFDAAETREELEEKRMVFTLAPASYEEHKALKEQKEKKEKTRCRVCKLRLKLAEQTLLCSCERAFCSKHRNPNDHHCPIDYKQTGREKISKDNPKVDGGKGKGKVLA